MNSERMLHQNGLKNTRHRDKILSILLSCDRPMTVDDVFFALSPQGRIALSTVYRCINTLCEKGILKKSVQADNSKTFFEVADGSHRHYITCTCCKRRQLLNVCPLAELDQQVNKETGFSVQTHHLELYGLCPECLGERNE